MENYAFYVAILADDSICSRLIYSSLSTWYQWTENVKNRIHFAFSFTIHLHPVIYLVIHCLKSWFPLHNYFASQIHSIHWKSGFLVFATRFWDMVVTVEQIPGTSVLRMYQIAPMHHHIAKYLKLSNLFKSSNSKTVEYQLPK